MFLKNMNIVVPDETIMGLFKYLDEDNNGYVSAKEFIKAFGHAISGEKADNIGDAEHVKYIFLYLSSLFIFVVCKIHS